MGVHGLWELLAPVGRRVSVETLAGKRLAIDASIWLVQFMKAMRDEKGDMVRNAHILGFFRRICKLLFLRTKPVLVFDGGTPALKRRTVIARRRQRENAQAKIRKTAEKLLLNHLKTMRLKELAEGIKSQRQNNDLKGKNVVSEFSEVTEKSLETSDKVTEGYDQEALDKLLAASLAAEEDGVLTTNASASTSGVGFEEEDDEDEEMILPTMHGKVDPSVLASLPPSMQLDLLVQMRESLMAENRQKYQKVKKAPAKFSELQIQSYLKTVAFRREIDEVQKTAAGRGVGGVQSSRIASEANREFIFSSSFTGDKEILASAGVKRNGDVEHLRVRKDPASSDSTNHISSVTQASSKTASGENELRGDLDDGVERYFDERGRLRVSRVRAMGIRMTRDLQRNLDLMKEIEQDNVKDKNSSDLEAFISEKADGGVNKFPIINQLPESSDEIISVDDGTDMLVQGECQKTHERSILKNRSLIEISFTEDENKCEDGDNNDGDNDLFAQLVAGKPVLVCAAENASSGNLSCASDCARKEGTDLEKGGIFGNDSKEKCGPSLAEQNSDASDVDWEEGGFDVPRNASPSPPALNNVVSRGSLEEEADLQEAIRRSLEVSTPKKPLTILTENKNTKISRELINQCTSDGFPFQLLACEKDIIDSHNLLRENDPSQSHSSRVAGYGNLDQIGEKGTLEMYNSPQTQLESCTEFSIKTDEKEPVMDESGERYSVSSLQILSEEASGDKSISIETKCTNLVPSASTAPHLTTDQFLGFPDEVGKVTSFTGLDGTSQMSSHVSSALMSDATEDIFVEAHQEEWEAVPTCDLHQTTANANIHEESLMKAVACGVDLERTAVAEKFLDPTVNSSIHDDIEVGGARMDEEMLLLREERRNLGEEQRKLERNAEAVSSEMFAECQELLQMFGLPYIIAPMEAEAQCAYMELSGLVDGVVTDDSDVFLFGARSVYKNIFDERKYVETYLMKDIETELGLTREQLIRIALLLGSDYTEGISGIGIVNAIEVVHAFPEEDGLQHFREWLESPDPTILGNLGAQTGTTLKKRGPNEVEAGSSVSTDNIPKLKKIFMDKHRNVSKNWHIPATFPSEAVISAYVSPQVDKSTEPFSWGKPDLFVLRNLCWEKLGWNHQKADDLLVPVLKEYNKHETQLRLEAFYTFNERFAKIRSKRIKNAVKGISGNRSSELMDGPPQEASEARKNVSGSKNITSEKPKTKQSRKRTVSEPMPSEIGHSESPIQKESRRNTRKGSRGNARRRGRGSGRGRGRGKEVPNSESSETSSGNEDDEVKMQDEMTERSLEVRRSKRPRKNVIYTGNDVEGDSLSDSLDLKRARNGNDETVDKETLLGEGMFEDDVSYGLKEVGSSLQQDDDDDLFRDYLEMGGGFCTEESKPENDLVLNRKIDYNIDNNNPFVEDGSSTDYLKMGGGFCMDKDEKDHKAGPSVSSPRIDVSNELVADIGKTGSSLNTDKGNEGNETNIVGIQLVEEEAVMTGQEETSTPTGLKAMPFLKRKPRKS